MPRRDKVVNILAVRYVKQGTETARFRTDSTSHSFQYVCVYKPLDLISNRKYREATWNGKYGDRSHKLGNAVAFLVENMIMKRTRTIITVRKGMDLQT